MAGDEPLIQQLGYLGLALPERWYLDLLGIVQQFAWKAGISLVGGPRADDQAQICGRVQERLDDVLVEFSLVIEMDEHGSGAGVLKVQVPGAGQLWQLRQGIELVVPSLRDLVNNAAEALLIAAGLPDQQDMARRVLDSGDQQIADRSDVSDAEDLHDLGPRDPHLLVEA